LWNSRRCRCGTAEDEEVRVEEEHVGLEEQRVDELVINEE